MRLKLDENLGRRVVEMVRRTNHEVSTVSEQGLEGSTDSPEDLFSEVKTLIIAMGTAPLQACSDSGDCTSCPRENPIGAKREIMGGGLKGLAVRLCRVDARGAAHKEDQE